MEEYSFIAGFTRDPVAIAVEFPDLPGCLTQGDNYREAFLNAKEALHLHLVGMIMDGEEIPKPSTFEDITPNEGTIFRLVEIKI